MSNADLVYVAGGIITILGGQVVHAIIAWQTSKSNADISKLNGLKLDRVGEQVNGAHSASVEEIAELRAEVAALKQLVAGQRQDAAVLAAKTEG